MSSRALSVIAVEHNANIAEHERGLLGVWSGSGGSFFKIWKKSSIRSKVKTTISIVKRKSLVNMLSLPKISPWWLTTRVFVYFIVFKYSSEIHTNLYICILHCIYHTLYSEIRPHYIHTHCEYNQLTLTLKNSQYKELLLVNRYHDRGLAFGKALEEYIGNCSFEHFALS